VRDFLVHLASAGTPMVALTGLPLSAAKLQEELSE
jgi:hypothetical protein